MVKIKITKTTKKQSSKSAKYSTVKSAKIKSSSKKTGVKTRKPATLSKQKGTASKPKETSASISASKTKKKKTSYGSIRDKMIHKIKMELLGQKTSLLNEAEMALNELPGQTVFPDLGDQATAETDRNFMLRLREREQRLLQKIDEALDRIEKKTFGICEDCGEEIDIKRLAARPVTTMCIDCKTLQEEEEKLRAS